MINSYYTPSNNTASMKQSEIDSRFIPGYSSERIQPVLVIGAGMMGKLIAGWLAVRGATVKITDKNDFNRETALKSIYSDIKHREDFFEIKGNTANLIKSENRLSIYNNEDVNGYLIIESVPEDYNIKINCLKPFANKGAVLTTCSMSLDIITLSKNIGQEVKKCRFLHPVYFIGAVDASPDLDLQQFGLNSIQDNERRLTPYERYLCTNQQIDRVLYQKEITIKNPINTLECVICMDRPEQVMFGCGHSNICSVCAYEIQTCHVCRHPITSRRMI